MIVFLPLLLPLMDHYLWLSAAFQFENLFLPWICCWKHKGNDEIQKMNWKKKSKVGRKRNYKRGNQSSQKKWIKREIQGSHSAKELSSKGAVHRSMWRITQQCFILAVLWPSYKNIKSNLFNTSKTKNLYDLDLNVVTTKFPKPAT